MMLELRLFLEYLRPAFSRRATYVWCVIVMVGLVVRSDTLGISSIVRALALAPVHYPGLVHFYHSSAWCVHGLVTRWWYWLLDSSFMYRHQGRLVLIGDHTKTPKDGRKMPGVVTLHQDSETSSKPSFFRGHHWGFIAALTCAAGAWRATPLWAAIHEGTDDTAKVPKTVRIVDMARTVLAALRHDAYMVLDAYFAVGPVFAAANAIPGIPKLFILTRAKKNVVAFLPPSAPKPHTRGRKKLYGRKLHLMRLFDTPSWARKFSFGTAHVYDHTETVRFLALDLLWKPIKGTIRFILVESSRGRMILMSSDLYLAPLAALQLYCRRVPIEIMFDTLKNTFSAFCYHFWSRYLVPSSRRPSSNPPSVQHSSNPLRTQETMAAIEKFVNLQIVLLGFLHLIAFRFHAEVRSRANCWLRTSSASIPSEFVTRMAFVNSLRSIFAAFAKNWITTLIATKQSPPSEKNIVDYRNV